MINRNVPSRWPGQIFFGAFIVVLLALSAPRLEADSTWVYAVQISAVVQVSPPHIALSWVADQYGADSYTIYRKAKTDTSWGSPIATLDGSVSNYTDVNVVVGSTYEYQIVKAASLGYTGYGYIYSGINAPLTEGRGKLILVVEAHTAPALATELTRLASDLAGDGWQVIRHDVSSNDTPANMRALIVADYNADPANVKSVFLLGHIPILQSGNLDYDTHGNRPMPADVYYGDVNGDWSSLPDYLPSDVELTVGRVDMFNLPGATAAIPYPNETALLRNYLNKDHAWRFKQISFSRRALLANRFGDLGGEARAATGYRNLQPFVGPGNIIEADISDAAPPDQRWISLLSSNVTYLWTYGCGGGFDTGISELGLRGQYNDVWSTDLVDRNARAIFFMLEGSHFGNWDVTDNVMRSVLAEPSYGLAVCCIAGRPHWFVHHVGLGETLGYGARLTQNNSTLYQNQINDLTRAIYIELLGDPTLRMEPVAPPSNLSAGPGGGGMALSWTASPDAVAGYHVYRAASPAGPFTRLTGSLITGTSFTDGTAPVGSSTYLVRAVALQTNPSGSYFNPSQGIFATANNTGSAPPMNLAATLDGGGLHLNWNSQSGIVYRVWARAGLDPTVWSNASGTLRATGATTTWTDANVSQPQRFYRVSSP